MDQKDQHLLIKIFYFSLLKIFSRFMFEQQKLDLFEKSTKSSILLNIILEKLITSSIQNNITILINGDLKKIMY